MEDLQAAADAGMAPEAMRSAIEDSYYDQDLEGARQALRDAMPTEPGPGAKAEPQGSAPAASTAPKPMAKQADIKEARTAYARGIELASLFAG